MTDKCKKRIALVIYIKVHRRYRTLSETVALPQLSFTPSVMASTSLC